MSLFIHGTKFWCELQIKGRRVRHPLHVSVEGTIPKPLSVLGDTAFEKSRRAALSAQEQLKSDFADPIKAVERLDRLQETLTGQPRTSVLVSDLFNSWLTTPRKRALKNVQRKNEVQELVNSLISFLGPAVTDFRQITYNHAAEFVAGWPSSMSPKGKSNRIINLRAVFAAAAKRAGVSKNVFKEIPLEDDDSIHREPYSPAELEKIIEESEADKEIGGMVIAAACTGMRRADCALLEWTAVDLKVGVVKIRAAKTNVAITIPILPPLRRWLDRQENKTGFCFPKAATLAKENPDGLNVRLKRLLQRAGVPTDQVKPAETGTRRMRHGTQVGFHRFKTTFVTLALSSGVPLPVLTKIIGNGSLRVILKHYNRPDDQALISVLEAKMPEVLTGRKQPTVSLADVRAQLAAMSAKSWKQIRDDLLENLPTPKNPTQPLSTVGDFVGESGGDRR